MSEDSIRSARPHLSSVTVSGARSEAYWLSQSQLLPIRSTQTPRRKTPPDPDSQNPVAQNVAQMSESLTRAARRAIIRCRFVPGRSLPVSPTLGDGVHMVTNS